MLCVLQKAFVFRDIELSLPSTGKVLIDKVTGVANAGRVLALMGPSGVCDMAQRYRVCLCLYFACCVWLCVFVVVLVCMCLCVFVT